MEKQPLVYVDTTILFFFIVGWIFGPVGGVLAAGLAVFMEAYFFLALINF